MLHHAQSRKHAPFILCIGNFRHRDPVVGGRLWSGNDRFRQGLGLVQRNRGRRHLQRCANRGLQRANPVGRGDRGQSVRRLLQSRLCLLQQGRIRPRDPRLHRSAQAEAGGSECLRRARPRLFSSASIRTGDRRFQRGNPTQTGQCRGLLPARHRESGGQEIRRSQSRFRPRPRKTR